eukprot:GHVN01009126.1.p1 GENE.GHVN01009126.1~~GHVN01009126.1.p1  ORF type:complete len:347 (-),score=34.95 GHVN01009126.1:227-1267(-)
MIVCGVGFIWYLWREFSRVDDSVVVQAKATEIRIQAISGKTMTLKGVMYELLLLQRQHNGSEERLLYTPMPAARLAMSNLLKPFFQHLDYDKSGQLDKAESRTLFYELIGNPTEKEIDLYFSLADSDGSGYIEFEEFVDMMIKYVVNMEEEIKRSHTMMERAKSGSQHSLEEEEDEKDEVPDDLAHLSPAQQKKRVLYRAFYLMLFGTLTVLIFSDPMVDVLSEVGKRTGIPAFYVSFVFAPLASNASEIIAAFLYAKKKTRKSVDISFSTLCGAASMNNTFVLGIFLAIVYFKNLVWVYGTETLAILLIQLAIGMISQKEIQYLWLGFVALLLYPLSLALVAGLK